MTLDEIAAKFGTDKACSHATATPHCYTPHYEEVFGPFRDEPIKLLEIGVGGGESVQTWLEYFPNGRIYGVDLNQNTNPWNTPKAPTHPRYIFMQGDQGDPVMWACFLADQGSDWNIIIDDGSHYARDVIASFNALWPHVKPEWLYCIEDLAVSYGGHPFTAPNTPTHMDFLKEKLDEINQKGEIRCMRVSKELAIIQKVKA